MTSSIPTTPNRLGSATPGPSTPTGSWRHPAMDVVAKRNSERVFTDVSFRRLSYNTISLILSFAAVKILANNEIIINLTPSSPRITSYISYAIWTVRALLAFNILESLVRLLRPVDEFNDIPLTPDQRKLLGLNPNTPLSVSASGDIITPPRYTKSTPSSRSGSPSFGSTSIGPGSPTSQRKAAHITSPPSMTPSPLRMGGGFDRRSNAGSFGSPGGGLLFGTPNAGAAGGGVKMGAGSVVPGSRWIYEKNLQRKGDGARYSPGRSIFGSPAPRP